MYRDHPTEIVKSEKNKNNGCHLDKGGYSTKKQHIHSNQLKSVTSCNFMAALVL